MKTWDEITAERQHAGDLATSAGNALGGLYNALGDIGEDTVEQTISRRDNCLRVLDAELANIRRCRDKVVAAINERIFDLPNDQADPRRPDQ